MWDPVPQIETRMSNLIAPAAHSQLQHGTKQTWAQNTLLPHASTNVEVLTCISVAHNLEYVICSNQIKQGEARCRVKASQNDLQSTRSKAFDKSRLTIHKGMFVHNVSSITVLAVNKCSSVLRLFLNSCCSSGWQCSDGASIRPKIKDATIFYFLHEADVCDRQETCCDSGLLRFWQHLGRFAPSAEEID